MRRAGAANTIPAADGGAPPVPSAELIAPAPVPIDGPRTALVLGGGGNLGALQLGFIRRVAELAIPVDFVVGTSVGALNAAHVAFHADSGHDCLTEIWRALASRRPFHRSIRRVAWQVLRHRMSLFDDSFVRRIVAEHLDVDGAVTSITFREASGPNGRRTRVPVAQRHLADGPARRMSEPLRRCRDARTLKRCRVAP